MTAGAPERATTGRRHEVLAALRDARSPLTVGQLADRLAVHPNTVRFHLAALVEAGQAVRTTSLSSAATAAPGSEPRAGAPGTPEPLGRPPVRYTAAPGMDPRGERRYDMLAAVLATELEHAPDAAARAERAGRAWGAQQARHQARHQAPEGDRPRNAPPSDDDATTQLMTLLAELGFAPDGREHDGTPTAVESRPAAVGLRSCPFLELATTSPVVCPVHLGLMRGALDAWDSTLTVERLQPFAEPDLCLAHLGKAPGG
ncbi:helix-turn-helix transcriptional regulator [Xylanimonas sp. McL0601]|uniref:helix-turn-helix transcriptional regulator n=1 Tax=Xylanimonas sp. McL0601 TaxID=3414739 RepID=UPI003CEFE110